MTSTEMLPLRPVAFAVLASLSDGAMPGFGILERVNESLPDRPLLGPGSLYRLLRELRKSGLLTRTEPPIDEAGSEDERRHYHELTPLGRQVLHAEAARLRGTLARAGLLTSTPGF